MYIGQRLYYRIEMIKSASVLRGNVLSNLEKCFVNRLQQFLEFGLCFNCFATWDLVDK